MITIHNLSKQYNQTYALRNLSLSFNSQETVAIIGASGSGKSTLLRCITFLEPPTEGTIEINRITLNHRNRNLLCQKIGMVFQSFNLFNHMSVIDNLIYAPLKLSNLNKKDLVDKAHNLLEQFKLKSKFADMPIDLSGGQKQRAAICRALMNDPEVLLFDEPTSALDPENIKDIIEIITSLKHKITVIAVTHHLKFAKAIADRIIFMDKGLALADQVASEFFIKPKSQRAKLFLENVGDLM